MTTQPPAAELLFTEADATPMSTDEATVKPWHEARECLRAAPKVWLSTTRPDGRAHVAPVLVVWGDDTPCFATRPGSRKAHNLAHDPRCVVTIAGQHIDLVVEGNADTITDTAELHRTAELFDGKYRWQLSVRGSRVHDHALPGPPEYRLYRLRPTLAFGYGTHGLTATRWRFG